MNFRANILARYAYKYECPQIFCFDHQTFLMLQFRAATPADIRTSDVDCWVFPRDNQGGTPLRYALYRLIVQGFRRFQGMRRFNTPLHNSYSSQLTFFSGKPQWVDMTGHHTSYPFNYKRKVDSASGALYWVDEDGNDVVDLDGNRVWDTDAFW